MVHRLDARRRLALLALVVFFGGWAFLHVGVPIAYGEALPPSVTAIPPAIFASVVLLMLAGNVLQVRAALRLLTLGATEKVVRLWWMVYPVGAEPGSDDLRALSLPVRAPGDAAGVLFDLALLDQHRDWNPRQTRSIVVELAGRDHHDDASTLVANVPSTVTATDLERGSVLRLETAKGIDRGLCIPEIGLFAVVAVEVHVRQRP
ncbi:MAG: hypothetical protein AAF721_01365 [Myxococcota bacterium]